MEYFPFLICIYHCFKINLEYLHNFIKVYSFCHDDLSTDLIKIEILIKEIMNVIGKKFSRYEPFD